MAIHLKTQRTVIPGRLPSDKGFHVDTVQSKNSCQTQRDSTTENDCILPRFRTNEIGHDPSRRWNGWRLCQVLKHLRAQFIWIQRHLGFWNVDQSDYEDRKRLGMRRKKFLVFEQLESISFI